MESGTKPNLNAEGSADKPIFICPSSQIRKRSKVQTKFSEKGKVHNDEHEHYIPEGLLDEILMRLPLKSIFQFKCVCKRWLSLISSPSFIRSYCLLLREKISNSSLTLPWTFLYAYTCGQRFEHIPEERKLRRVYSCDHISPQFSLLHSFPHGWLEIVTENNGLLLCRQLNSNRHYICNPITKQWVALPCMPVRDRTFLDQGRIPQGGGRNHYAARLNNAIIGRIYANRFGFYSNEGLIAVVNDSLFVRYKVVVPLGDLRLSIFSSENGQWTEFKPVCHPPTSLHSVFLSTPVAVNGTLYWPSYMQGLVLSYEPFGDKNRCMTSVKLPMVQNVVKRCEMCGVSCGRLRYYAVSVLDGENVLMVWELEASNSGKWSIKHTCPWRYVWSGNEYLTKLLTDMGMSSKIYFAPVAFHPFDLEVMYLHNGEYIVSYNFNSRRLDIVCDPQSSFTGLSSQEKLPWWDMLPLTLPVWPTLLPEPVWSMNSS